MNLKPVRRNSEKRKEKSRNAARCRRSKESEIFMDLANYLPLPPATVTHLDKASIMRLVIAHFRVRNIFKKVHSISQLLKAEDHDGLFLTALGGIVFVFSMDGDIVYVSSNVSGYLGLSQVDLLGQSIYDFSHPCDHTELKDFLCGKSDTVDGQVSVFLRVKCPLTSKGRNLNLKPANYKVLHISGYSLKIDESDKDSIHFVTIGSPIPHPVNIEVPLGTYTFLSKHSLDMKYTYADERMTNFLGYSPENLIGKSLYEFHHVLDNKNIERAFKSLFIKGQSETGHYRFLAKGGGYVWVHTQATLIYTEKGDKPHSVVCVNYVVSERHNEVEIYSSHQLEGVKVEEKTSRPIVSTLKVFAPAKQIHKEDKQKLESTAASQRPQSATAKIFAPRTEDMNKGFLMFSDDDSGFTMLKDEPEDLTHLAPTAGDVCVPLCNPMTDSLFDSIMVPLSNNYCPLINEDKDTPFFASYRDDISSGSISPTLSQSPGGCSLPSLCSLGDDTNRFEDSPIKSLLSLDHSLDLVDTDSDDLTVKAPYIPMNEGDDLPLLLNTDFMWSVGFPSPNSIGSSSSCAPSPAPDAAVNDNNCSSLATLLKSEPKKPVIRCQDQGGGDKTSALIIDTSSCSSISYSSPLSGDSERRKRGSTLEPHSAKKRKQTLPGPDSGGGNSVLMNLLVAGCDVSAGYICLNPRKQPTSNKLSQEMKRNS